MRAAKIIALLLLFAGAGFAVFWALKGNPAPASSGSGSATAETGRTLYLSHGCAACHGREGDGQGMIGRQLNPPPTNFRDPAAYRFGRDAKSVRLAIAEGVHEDGSQMPAFKSLEPAELDALASYVVSLQENRKNSGGKQ